MVHKGNVRWQWTPGIRALSGKDTRLLHTKIRNRPSAGQ